jgi:cell division septation protein DedD
MKLAFFLVLLANLTLLMHQYHRGAFQGTAETAGPEPAMLREPIVLAREQENGPPAAQSALAEPVRETAVAPEAESPPPAPQSPPLAPLACYEAGPFANEQVLKAWEQAVKEVRGELKPIPHPSQQITDYLVLYPTAGSPEAVKAAMETLRSQGVGDAYPLAAGELKGYISLGAFHRENRAARMQKELRERGIEAAVKPRFKASMQKFALIKGPSALAGGLGALEKRYPGVQLKALPDDDPNCREEGGRQAEVTAAEKEPQHDAAEIRPVRLACYEAGPFPNEQSLGVWQKRISGAQAAVKPVFRDGKAVSDYLVLYPSAGGAEEAKAAMKMLRERGLNDAWPLPSGDEKGQISLGVFSREENAVQMQRSLFDKGISSVVKPRYKSKRQKYVLITAPESIAGDLKALEKKYPDIKLRQVTEAAPNCP